jgi:hypothetical protein
MSCSTNANDAERSGASMLTLREFSRRNKHARRSCVTICLLILAALWLTTYHLITTEKDSEDVAGPGYG